MTIDDGIGIHNHTALHGVVMCTSSSPSSMLNACAMVGLAMLIVLVQCVLITRRPISRNLY